MARYRRRDSIETRLAEDLEVEGVRYTVDLIAKRATGVTGYRLTLAFLARDGSRTAFVDLEPAPGREEAKARAESLRSDPAALRGLLRGRSEEGAPEP
ncbi:MAG: hypothetical protein ACE5JR_12690 [Gemmatimonadota bacterium]